MQRISGMLWRCGVLLFFGLTLVSLMPWSAQAGGLHVDVGLSLPVPVVVAPAPVVVQPVPVVVPQPPVIVQQPSVVIAEPYPGRVYYPYYGHGWYKRAKHWHHRHGYDH